MQFSKLMHLPTDGVLSLTHDDNNRGAFLSTISCSRQRYVAMSTKAMWIYNPVLRYLQHLIVNHLFPRADSQNGVRVEEPFLLWVALH